MKKIAIIGGGIAGLAAAHRLQKEIESGSGHIDYVLIEGDKRLGGKILTEKVGEYLIEGGPDCFLSEKPEVLTISKELGLESALMGTNDANKGTFVLSGGKLHRLPEGLVLMVPAKITPFLMSGLISWPGKMRMLMDLFIPRRQTDGDETLASFVTRRLGREALDKIAEPLVAGIHAGDPETMSLMASFPRFLDMEAKHGSLLKAMLSARKKRPPAPSAPNAAQGFKRTYFMTFKDGLGQLVEAIERRLDKSRLLTSHTVTGIAKNSNGNGGFVIRLRNAEPIMADAVVLAIPAHAAKPIIKGLSPALADLVGQIGFTSTATVSLAYKREQVPHRLEGFGFVIPSVEKRRIMAVTYSSIKWDHRAPDGHVLLRIFVGGLHNQNLVEGGGDLIAVARDEVKQILGITAEPSLAKAYRWNRGMPQYTLGHLERIKMIDRELHQIPGLHLAGGSYRGVGLPDCIRSGVTAVQTILQQQGVRSEGLGA